MVRESILTSTDSGAILKVPSPSPHFGSTPSPPTSPQIPTPSSYVAGASIRRVDVDTLLFNEKDPGKLKEIPEEAFIVVDEVRG